MIGLTGHARADVRRAPRLPPARGPVWKRARVLSGWLLTALSVALVWFALTAPDSATLMRPVALARIPVEGLVIAGLVLALPRRVRPWLEIPVGVALALLVLVRVLDFGFQSALRRPFNPVTDWRHAASAKDLLSDSIGPTAATLGVAAIALLVVGVLVGTPLAVRRISGIIVRHRVASGWTITILAVVWALSAVLGLRVLPDVPLASSSAATLAAHEVSATRANLHDREVFGAMIPVDPFASTPGSDLLTALRGKDVLVVFVESYGRVAVERSPDVAAELDSGTRELAQSGYSSRSAWLTSPTFAGLSWLAHSSLQSGLRVDSQQRYDQLVSARRLTLARAFSRAGWRTVDVVPANRQDWPEGKAFYGYDTIYDSRTLGYAGPGFGYAPMPDQFTLSAFDHLELDRPARSPVMAEIDLVTSHVPWAPLPELVDWSSIGDGSVFLAQAGRATPQSVVWSSAAGVRSAYGKTVAYSLASMVGFLRETRDRDLVVVMLGDHQPLPIVSGPGASHDVPVTVIARDPAVLARIDAWRWSEGLKPGTGSPVWPMDQFRDRFLTAYGSSPRGP